MVGKDLWSSSPTSLLKAGSKRGGGSGPCPVVFSVSPRIETSQASSPVKLFHCSMTLTVKIEEILLKHKKKVFQFVSTASQKHKLYFFLSQKF